MKAVDLSNNMRRALADELHKHMSKNPRIWVLSGDLGYKMWDEIRNDFPDRFLNAGSAEHSMTGIAVGLALNGKIPVVFSITSFLLYRPFETIRNYIDHEKIPVKLIGSGRGRDYLIDGFTHWAEEDKKVMKIFKNIESRWPRSIKEIPALVSEMIKSPKPWYINLKR